MSTPRPCSNPCLSGLTVEPNVEQQIKLMTRQLVSRPTLEKVARMTDLDVKAKTPADTETMLNNLAGKIGIADAGRENLYTIKLPGPERRSGQEGGAVAVDHFRGNQPGQDPSGYFQFAEIH